MRASPSGLLLVASIAALLPSCASSQGRTQVSTPGARDRVADRLARLFLPRFESPKKSVNEWLEQLDGGRGQDAIDALWCVYWSGDRSERVIRRLMARCAEADAELKRELDVVLTQWNVPHEAPPPCWPRELPGGKVTSSELDEIIGRISGIDGATVAEIMTDRPWGGSGDASLYLAPAGAFCPGIRLLDRSNAETEAALGSEDRVVQAEAAATLASRGKDIPGLLGVLRARDAADPASVGDPSYGGSSSFSIGGDDPGRTPSEWNEVEYGVWNRWTRKGSASWVWPVELTTRAAISWICAFAGSAADAGTNASKSPGTIPHRTRTDSPYVVKSTVTELDPHTMSLGERVSQLVDQLETRLALNQDPETVLTTILDLVEPSYADSGAGGPGDQYSQFLWWLAAHAFSDPRVTDWCLAIATSNFPFSSHLEPAMDYLSRQKLDQREQAILCRYNERGIGRSSMGAARFTPSVFARQGESAIELAGFIRYQAQRRQDLDLLDALLAIAKASSADHEMLLAALQRGVAGERLRALRIVDERKLDTPDLRTAAREAQTDLDLPVRVAAAALVKSRSW